eukprot:SAG31_NODE_429_length_15801_cov_6.878551_15_plen_117_part_00
MADSRHGLSAARPNRDGISMNGYIPSVLRSDKVHSSAGGDAADGVLAKAEKSFEERQKDMHDQAVKLQNIRDLRRVFDRIDTNGDGILDEEEVEAYLIRLGYTPQRVRSLAPPVPL